jgi:hypothetical protein
MAANINTENHGGAQAIGLPVARLMLRLAEGDKTRLAVLYEQGIIDGETFSQQIAAQGLEAE